MGTFKLVVRKVGHFVTVLFLSSLLLAVLLWFSPGSPSRPRDSVVPSALEAGEVVCLDAERCGLVESVSVAETGAFQARVRLADSVIDAPAVDLLDAAPGFLQWFLGDFWGGVLRWDMGPAYNMEPILDVVLFGARNSLPIVAGALLVTLSVALLLPGLLTWLPFPSLRGFLRIAVLALSISPVFILGFLLTNMGVLPHPVHLWIAPAACVLILSLGDSNLGEMLLTLENEVRVLRGQDYIHAAGLRGASRFRHMLPGLLLPISALSAAKIAFLLGSVVIAEFIYAVQGLGWLSLQAATKPDPLLLLTLTVFTTGVVAGVALVRDLLEIAIDPRIRRGRGGAR